MTKRNPLPSYETVREFFDYDPETGILRWKVKRANKEIGDVAGCQRGSGYWQVGIEYKLYRVHLIIWLWVTGAEPKNFIDHENTIKSDNRWVNLREATKSQNQANIGLTKANTSGLKGASRYRAGDSYGMHWQSAIVKDGKHMHLGHFATAEEAHVAYCDAAKRLFGKYARMK